MKVILLLAVVVFILIVFRGKISTYLKEELNITSAINEEEAYLQSIIEKFAQEETALLFKRSEGTISELERKAIQIVLRKREGQLYNA